MLGLMHGPAELMPISSSAHITLAPWLLGWNNFTQDSEIQKSFAVALHAGTAAGLLIALRKELSYTFTTTYALVPAALLGLVAERPIEQKLGTPPVLAAGLTVGAILLAWGDLAPKSNRTTDTLSARDGLWLGAAQALALLPGISRQGATFAAARRLGFSRASAGPVARRLGLPIIAGAAGLKSIRLARRQVDPEERRVLLAGSTAAFFSTLLCAHWRAKFDRTPVTVFASYRLLLSTLVAWRSFGGHKSAST